MIKNYKKNKMISNGMKKFLFIFIIFLSLSIFGAQNAQAASVSFGTASSVNTEENLDVVVNADTGGVLINSIEFIINYNEDLLSFTGYSDDNAVVKLWIDPPHAKQGKIYLSGIIPGGVLGLYDASKQGLSAIPLVHLLFTTKKVGEASFSFVDSKILENDGEGTSLPHDQNGVSVVIKNNPNSDNSVKEVPENTTNNDLSNSPNSLNILNFAPWIILFVVILGILCYKLKHKI
jgi:hypothetical protein